MTPDTLVYPLHGEQRRPMVPVQLVSTTGQPFAACFAILDTGSYFTYAPAEIMGQLGVDEDMCEPAQYTGLTETLTEGLRSTVDVPVILGGYVIKVRPIFTPGPAAGYALILGEEAFRAFDVTISGRRSEVRLDPDPGLQFVGVHRSAEDLTKIQRAFAETEVIGPDTAIDQVRGVH